MNSKNIKRFLGYIISTLHVILLAAMIIVGLLSLFRPDIMRGVIDWMWIQIKSWWEWNYVILFVVAMIESFPFVGVVVPGMNMMILVGGFFVAKQWEIFPLAALLAMTGACLGNALGYFMGRYGNPDTLKKYWAFFWAGPKELAWLEKQINKNWFWFIVGGKFHNLLRAFIPYIAGSHKMSGARFWVANIFGSSLWAVSILLVWVFAVENYEVVLQYLNYIILAIVLWGVIYYYSKQKK
jgi:membrane protein DedA with SNARE-associated domain